MGSKIIWRPKAPVWSDGIFGPRHPRPGMRFGAAVLICGVAAVSIFDVFEEFAGEQQRAAAQLQASPLGKPGPVLTIDSTAQGQSSDSTAQGQSSPTAAASDNAVSHPAAAPARAVTETTGSASSAVALPSNADTTAATANALAAAEPPEVAQPSPKRRTSRKRSARKVETGQAYATQAYTMPDGRQITLRRSGRNANAPDGGLWGYEFAGRAGAPIQLAHQRAFGWPF